MLVTELRTRCCCNGVTVLASTANVCRCWDIASPVDDMLLSGTTFIVVSISIICVIV